MQALYNYLENWETQGIDEYRMEVKRIPAGFVFRLSPMGREVDAGTTLEFVVTRMGMSPVDTRSYV